MDKIPISGVTLPRYNSKPSLPMSEDQNQNNQLNIELSEEVAEGIYSNLAIITHSPAEFILD